MLHNKKEEPTHRPSLENGKLANLPSGKEGRLEPYAFSQRCEQDLNLRGETPLDFKSNALTTRPSQPESWAAPARGTGLPTLA